MRKHTSILILIATVIIVSSVKNYVYSPQRSTSGFSIILTNDDSTILSDKDVQSYNVSSYQLILTEECANRMKKRNEPLTGDFIITINGEENLHGIFVPPVVSRSYPSTEVVIIYPSLPSDYNTMKIQMGYPWDQPTENDPRRDSKMNQYFEENGKLTR